MAKQKRTQSKSKTRDTRLFTVDVVLIGGPVTQDFAEKNKIVSRTIQIRGDQTLEQLHDAIFESFDREEEHLYEFRFNAEDPQDRNATVYQTAPMGPSFWDEFDEKPAGYVHKTKIGSVGLKEGDNFFYWFDFGDDWWHRIDVLRIDETAPAGSYPLITERKGDSPPQYPDYDDEEDDEDDEDDEDSDDDGSDDDDT